MNIPNILTAGDTWTWADPPVQVGADRYDPAIYDLAYQLRGPASLSITGTAIGAVWAFSVAATDSDMHAGDYSFFAIATAGDYRRTVGTGRLKVLPNPLNMATPHSTLTKAEHALAECRNALAGFQASKGKVQEYEILGRKMKFSTVGEILQAINYWQVAVRNERHAADIANGLGNPRVMYARFTR